MSKTYYDKETGAILYEKTEEEFKQRNKSLQQRSIILDVRDLKSRVKIIEDKLDRILESIK